MYKSRLIRLWVSIAFIAGVPLSAQALIINIDAQSNGIGNPVEVLLSAGEYSIDVIGTGQGGAFDAWNAWGSSNCADANGCARTAPTSFTGWMSAYEVLSPSISAVNVEGAALTAIGSPPVSGFSSIFVSGAGGVFFRVDDGNVYGSAASALANSLSSSFTLSAQSLVGFQIRDTLGAPLADNLGGLSLEILAVSPPGPQPVPEPATITLLVMGLLWALRPFKAAGSRMT